MDIIRDAEKEEMLKRRKIEKPKVRETNDWRQPGSEESAHGTTGYMQITTQTQRSFFHTHNKTAAASCSH